MTNSEGEGVKRAFEDDLVLVRLDDLVPLKSFQPGMKESKKFRQIKSSVRVIGLVEPPAVSPDPDRPGKFFLLDGHLRLEALKELGETEVDCLVSTDDETYTYNKRINRISALQEHKMIMLAVERGVSEERIAEALELEVNSVRRKFRLLDGICDDAVELLKDTICPAVAFDVLRRMSPARQREAAELMIGQNNFTEAFAKALLVATPEKDLVQARKPRVEGMTAKSAEDLTRMENELTKLQAQVRLVEDTYGLDNLHLTVAKGYVSKLLANPRVVRWLTTHRQEYVSEFQSIAGIEAIGVSSIAAE
jgi:hypothetical protein